MKHFLCALFLMLINVPFGGQNEGKQQVAVFVYCDKSVSTPVNALTSRLTSSLIDGGNSQYDVVDRSEEILELLKKEYKYQGAGLVRDDQLTSIGEHLGIDLICAVNITYYGEYNQYFFDCKMVNMETRKVEKQVYFPNNNNGQRVITDLSPQSQLSVAQELASSIGLYSSAQVVEREYSIGDIYYDKNNKPVGTTGDYYRVGFLDGTKKHGIAFRIVGGKRKWPQRFDSGLGGNVPTIRQMQLLRTNRDLLGLYGEYWSCDKGPSTTEKYYNIKAYDFFSGRITDRHSASSNVFEAYSRKIGDGKYEIISGPSHYVFYDGYDELENISIIVF